MAFYISIIVLTFCFYRIVKFMRRKDDKEENMKSAYAGDVDQYKKDLKIINEEFMVEKYIGRALIYSGLFGAVSAFHLSVFVVIFDSLSEEIINRFYVIPFKVMICIIFLAAVLILMIRILNMYILKRKTILGISSKILIENMNFKKIIEYSLFSILIAVLICVIILNFGVIFNYGLRDKTVCKYERIILSEKIKIRKYRADGKIYMVKPFYEDMTSVENYDKNINYNVGDKIVISLENGFFNCPVNIRFSK